MTETFNSRTLQAHLVRGDLLGAMSYLEQFPEQASLSRKYRARFEREEYMTYDVDPLLSDILRAYQQYYRQVFYLQRPEEEARDDLARGLRARLGTEALSLEELEKTAVARAFTDRGYHFLGGETSGYYGPYIWKTTRDETYEVELPQGRRPYTVRFLGDFLSRSWLDYISFGETGTGGWADDDGLIHCVESVYDTSSEDFTVSLLKHEAQHAVDLGRYKGLSSQELEYRAKLVELIYTRERRLLERFLAEADTSRPGNGHALAAEKIARGFAAYHPRETLGDLPTEEIQAIAGTLFRESCRELDERYGCCREDGGDEV